MPIYHGRRHAFSGAPLTPLQCLPWAHRVDWPHRRLDPLIESLVSDGVMLCPRLRGWNHRGDLPSVVVALPANNEDAVIGDALAGLAAAFRWTRHPSALMVFANTCDDATAEVVARAAPAFPGRVVVLEARLADRHATAGWARRIAMDAAARLCRPGGVILTTDADTRVGPGWIATLARAFARGHDVVCGRIVLDEERHLADHPPGVQLAHAEHVYGRLCDQVRYGCDQLLGRQPRGGRRPHYMESGANLGVTRECYLRIGGLPPVPSSEDRALVRAAEHVGARIHYCSQTCVKTSSRLVGRAQGGLAETLALRMSDREPVADQRLRPLEGIVRMWNDALASAHRDRGPGRRVRGGLGSWTGAVHDRAAAERHRQAEDDWTRALAAPRMRAADIEREIGKVATFLNTDVIPSLKAWSERTT